jgi:F-type H+-transporting ATPase subunit a
MIAGSETMPVLLGAESFTWWGLAGVGEGVPFYFIMGWVTALVLVGISVLVNISLKQGDPVIPKDPSQMGVLDWIRHMFEAVVEAMIDLLDSLMPHHHEGRGYLWLIAPIFLYIVVNNLMGLIPGMEPATSNANTNFAVAITVFVLYNGYGFYKVGWGYARHFWTPPGVPWWAVIFVGPLLLAIELIGHAFRPVTLTLRLFGNMTGDHAAFSTFLGMVPFGVPVIFMALGLLVCVVQAYVFTLLTGVYLTLATSHEH